MSGISTPSLATSSGGISPSRYAPVDAASPGARANGRSVLHAPPMVAFSSRTVTFSPARARKTAATSPLWPAPTTMACKLPSQQQGDHAIGHLAVGRPQEPRRVDPRLTEDRLPGREGVEALARVVAAHAAGAHAAEGQVVLRDV